MGRPRIHVELLKLGFGLAQSSVAKYMIRPRGPGDQGWRTFLCNHAPEIAAMDLFVVPTIGFRLLYAFIIVRLDRRHLVWTNVILNPTADWVARQIAEVFPWDEAPKYLIRDHDSVYGAVVTPRLRAMGIRDRPIAAASPWQGGYAERLIGSIRRECLDHVIVLGEGHLRRVLRAYADYYNTTRTHWSLSKDAPLCRPIQRTGQIASQSHPRWAASPIWAELGFQYRQVVLDDCERDDRITAVIVADGERGLAVLVAGRERIGAAAAFHPGHDNRPPVTPRSNLAVD